MRLKLLFTSVLVLLFTGAAFTAAFAPQCFESKSDEDKAKYGDYYVWDPADPNTDSRKPNPGECGGGNPPPPPPPEPEQPQQPGGGTTPTVPGRDTETINQDAEDKFNNWIDYNKGDNGPKLTWEEYLAWEKYLEDSLKEQEEEDKAFEEWKKKLEKDL